jgi:hypothetical protein
VKLHVVAGAQAPCHAAAKAGRTDPRQ